MIGLWVVCGLAIFACALLIARSIVRPLAQASDRVAQTSSGLSVIGRTLGQSSDAAADQAAGVATASEEVDASVSTVASAMEEMHASISEIATATGQASQAAEAAVQVVDATNQTIAKLGD